MTATKRSAYSFFYVLVIIGLLSFIITSFTKVNNIAGWALMIFFLSLAIAFRGHKLLKGYSFALIIIAGVCIGMYYPQYFVTVGNYKLTKLIIPFLQVIMFGMGTELSLRDFAKVFRMPKGIFVGIICHYTIMPLVGFTLAKIFNFPSEIAAGIILVGCSPSGLASNVMSYLARANLALSVSVTTVSTLLAPFLTPLLMKLLGGEFVEVHFWAMVWDITKIVILPVVAGLAFHYFIRGKMKWLDKTMPLLSMLGITFIILIIIAAGRDSLMTMGKLATVGLAPAIFGPIMNVNCSSLASWWHNHVPKEDLEENHKDIELNMDEATIV